MLDLINKTLGKFFGTKTDRDLKELGPYVPQTNEEFAKLQSLSNDELRAKTIEFKTKITEYLAETDALIAELSAQAEADQEMEANAKEDLYNSIDKLKKERNDKIEEALNEIHPAAFAVVKETAKRFNENAELKVTATDHDRNLAAKNRTYALMAIMLIMQTSGWLQVLR